MPNDARLGLVVGVTLLILVAVLFVRKDGPAANPTAATRPWAGGGALAANPPAPIPGLPGVPVGLVAPGTGRTHTVQDGETLMSVTKRYYGDGSYLSFLYEANRDRMRGPEYMPVGLVLRIPPAPRELAGRGRP